MYKTLLVHLDHSRHCAARLDVACALALRFDAHLIGAYAVDTREDADFLPQPANQDILRARLGLVTPNPEEAAAQFEAAGQRAGVPKLEFRVASGDATNNFLAHARYADLLVLGQSDPDERVAGVSTSFNELVMLAAGAPTLLVPYYLRAYPRLGTRALISWDGGREAARAVKDALPLLQTSTQVIALTVQGGKHIDGADSASVDLAAYLAHHGVRVEAAQSHAGEIDIGDALLARLADDDIDLLVMGAYGHSRLRELVLGGVTQKILKHMTAPVLMSH